MSWNEAFAMGATPPADINIPDVVHEIAAGREIRPTWRNEFGGITFALGDDRYLKWQSTGTPNDLGDEVWRLLWAGRYARVPRVIDDGGDEHGRWILTETLHGHNAVSRRWRDEPATAVRAIGAGLRALHDRLPVDDCPFEWTVEGRIAAVRTGGRREPAQRHPDHQHLDFDAAITTLDAPPDIDQLVVCHGDACAPNTLINDAGHWFAHVDLGTLGVADRWADIAIATWSTQWNYGDGWDNTLLDAYGIEPDPERTDYYRLLWDLSP